MITLYTFVSFPWLPLSLPCCVLSYSLLSRFPIPNCPPKKTVGAHASNVSMRELFPYTVNNLEHTHIYIYISMLNVYMDDYLHAGAAGFWVLFLKRQTCKKVESAALLTRAQETLRLAKFEQDFSSDRSGCELSVNEEQAETSNMRECRRSVKCS